MSENLVVGHDPVFQAAARIAGFVEAAVIDTDTGKVVMTRHRRSRDTWGPFHHLEPGENAAAAFYGCAFWERPDVAALFARKVEQKEARLARAKVDIRKDFRRDWHRLVAPRVDGKADLLEAMAAMREGRARIVRQQ